MESDRCGDYVLLARIGGGGMADVFAGRLPDATRLDEVVAIKRLRTPLAEEARYRIMFEDETRIAASIRHPHVVPILGHGIDEANLPYIVMPLVDGVTLATLLDESERLGVQVEPGIVAEVVAQAAEGLHAAHEARGPDGRPLKIIHRDVSPANIMVERNGRVRVADFGVAWAAERATRTLAGEVKGNLRYLSPEQLRNEPLDPRSDVFALGIVAWEALSRRHLFGADNPAGALHQILHDEAPRLEGALGACIAIALEKDRSRRYGNAESFARALRLATPHTNRAQIAHWVRQVALERIEAQKRMLTEAARALRNDTPSQPLPSIAPGRPSFPWKIVIVGALLGFGTTTTLMVARDTTLPTWSTKSLRSVMQSSEPSTPAAAPATPSSPSVVMTTMRSPSKSQPAHMQVQVEMQMQTQVQMRPEPDELRLPDYGMIVDPWR